MTIAGFILAILIAVPLVIILYSYAVGTWPPFDD
jgi:hypothetical protein